MSSPTELPPPQPAKWIVTTCRGRLDHLRQSLPSWLDRMPHWDPVVVCCDDPEAYEYAAGELMMAGRGLAVSHLQGQWFNRLEASRVGVLLAASGVPLDGRCIQTIAPARHVSPNIMGPPDNPSDVMVALLDCDIIALSATEPTIETVTPSQIGISSMPDRDEMGILVGSASMVLWSFDQIAIGSFNGYGYEDSAIRVGCWVATAGNFCRLRPNWAHQRHADERRVQFHEHSMREASTRNAAAISAMVRRLALPEHFEAIRADCFPSNGRKHARSA